MVEEPATLKRPVTPHALNAAARVELPAPPAPGKPPAGGPVRVVEVPLPGGRAGRVTPWAFRHATSAVRLALEPAVEADADVEVVVEVVDELLPHAAIARVAVVAASAGISRRARRRVLLGELMGFLFLVVS